MSGANKFQTNTAKLLLIKFLIILFYKDMTSKEKEDKQKEIDTALTVGICIGVVVAVIFILLLTHFFPLPHNI